MPNSCSNVSENLKLGFMAERKKQSKAWLHFRKKIKLAAVPAVMSTKWSFQVRVEAPEISYNIFSVQDGLKFQECHVFDTLLKSATASQH